MSETAGSLSRDSKILTPISACHFLSHYFNTCVPILFPILHTELDISFAALGLIWTVFNLATGAAQLPIGFLVDRLGAYPVLLVGLLLQGGAILFMGISPEYVLLLGLAVAAGIGHAVFHPADYTILSASINKKRIARAFSIHTFAGHLGNAAAPATIGALVLLFSWRKALIFSGSAAFLVFIWILLMRETISGSQRIQKNKEKQKDPGKNPQQDGWKLLLSTPMLMMFFFFIATSFTSSGITAFSVTVFDLLQNISMVEAGTALSGYLFASAVGVLAGGILADKTKRHDLVAILAFAATGLVMVFLGTFRSHIVLITVLYTLIGFGQGLVRPSRDMMIRAATPPGGMGKSFGFVSTGISVGGALAPILFGWLVDRGHPSWVFYGVALFMVLGIISVSAAKRSIEPQVE